MASCCGWLVWQATTPLTLLAECTMHVPVREEATHAMPSEDAVDAQRASNFQVIGNAPMGVLACHANSPMMQTSCHAKRPMIPPREMMPRPIHSLHFTWYRPFRTPILACVSPDILYSQCKLICKPWMGDVAGSWDLGSYTPYGMLPRLDDWLLDQFPHRRPTRYQKQILQGITVCILVHEHASLIMAYTSRVDLACLRIHLPARRTVLGNAFPNAFQSSTDPSTDSRCHSTGASIPPVVPFRRWCHSVLLIGLLLG